jgi:hypothetical protein
MKTTLICLLAAVAMRFPYQAGEAQEVLTARVERDAAINHAYALPRRFTLEWKIGREEGEQPGDEWRLWLTGVNADHADRFDERGYDPSYTSIVSDYKPIAKKLKNGKWEITFVSEIAEKLP